MITQTKLRTFEKYLIYFSLQPKHLNSYKFSLPPFLCLVYFLAAFFLSGCATTEEKLNRRLEIEKKFFTGIAYLEKNELRLARENFLGAIEMEPSIPKLHNALGRVYLMENKDDLAEERFKKVLKLDDHFMEAYLNLGALYMKQREFNKAIDTFRKLLDFPAIYPEYRTFNHLGGVYYERGDFDQAFLSLKKSISRNPGYMLARYNMGLALYALGFDDEAVKEFRLAAELSPAFPMAHNQLGLIYMKKKMYREALPEFRAVISGTKDKRLRETAKEYVEIIKKIGNYSGE